jgi:hypothetical protein
VFVKLTKELVSVGGGEGATGSRSGRLGWDLGFEGVVIDQPATLSEGEGSLEDATNLAQRHCTQRLARPLRQTLEHGLDVVLGEVGELDVADLGGDEVGGETVAVESRWRERAPAQTGAFGKCTLDEDLTAAPTVTLRLLGRTPRPYSAMSRLSRASASTRCFAVTFPRRPARTTARLQRDFALSQ